jgi:hypothetical protein
MIAVEVQHYLGRARGFLKGMDLLKEDVTEFRSSSALLGIHCAISYSDALRTGMGCADVSSDDHSSAESDLRSRLVARKFERLQGADRLGKLLSKKSKIAYLAETATDAEISDVVLQAKRFADWAEETGMKLKIEGWFNE